MDDVSPTWPREPAPAEEDEMTPTHSIDRAAPVVAAAVRETLPVAASIAPFALVIGATAARAGVPAVADMAAAATVFAGAAHLAVLTPLTAGARSPRRAPRC